MGTLQGSTAPIAFLPTPDIRVYRVANGAYEPLPHVRPLSDTIREGPEPGSARFEYVLDAVNEALFGTPSRFEALFPLGASSWWVVKPDDLVCIREENPDGSFDVLFAGFAQAPQLELSENAERVTFEAIGYPAREWDRIFLYAAYRDASDPLNVGRDTADPADPGGTADPQHFVVGLHPRFNPDGQPNCTPFGYDYHNGQPDAHPIFLDWQIVRDPDRRRHWMISDAAKYIICEGNPDQEYTKWPDLDALDDLLATPVFVNKEGDPNDPANYASKPIPCGDVDIFGMTWPEALERVIGPHGFTFTWRLTAEPPPNNPSGKPVPTWKLDIYRKDDANWALPVLHQPAGADVDLAQSNVTHASLQRDSTQLVNAYATVGAPPRYELAVVLAPAFEIDPADAAKARDIAHSPFINTHEDFDFLQYRLYHAGEAGDECWDFASEAMWVPDDIGLWKVFNEDADPEKRRSVKRRRPPLRKLLTRGNDLKLLDNELYISHDYAGDYPHVWNPEDTAHWQKIVGDGWKICDDRLGIQITVRDPNSWPIGKAPGGGTPWSGSGTVRIIDSMANPSTAYPRFWLKLVCVIEGDFPIDARAYKSPLSPTPYEIWRADDAAERYRLDRRHKSSPHYAASRADPNSPECERTRDDEEDADHASWARRRTHEVPKFGGTITLPGISRAYQIADRITEIRGRGCSLATTVGPKAMARYPVVVGIDHTYDPEFSTALHLDDRRAEPPPMTPVQEAGQTRRWTPEDY